MIQTEYLAGLFDGEGSVGLTLGSTKVGKYIGALRPTLQIVTTSAQLAEFAKLNWPNFNVSGPHSPTSKNNSKYYRLAALKQADIKLILNAIKPYLVVKSEQAKLMLNWFEEKSQLDLRTQLTKFAWPLACHNNRGNDEIRATRLENRKRRDLAKLTEWETRSAKAISQLMSRGCSNCGKPINKPTKLALYCGRPCLLANYKKGKGASHPTDPQSNSIDYAIT